MSAEDGENQLSPADRTPAKNCSSEADITYARNSDLDEDCYQILQEDSSLPNINDSYPGDECRVELSVTKTNYRHPRDTKVDLSRPKSGYRAGAEDKYHLVAMENSSDFRDRPQKTVLGARKAIFRGGVAKLLQDVQDQQHDLSNEEVQVDTMPILPETQSASG